MPDFEASARSSQIIPIPAPVHSVADLEAVITDGREPGGGFIAMADFFYLIIARK
jgi:hypothetical protein